MRKIYSNLKISSAFVMAIAGQALAQTPITLTFTHTGAAQTFTMPACVGNVTITAWGARGSDAGDVGGNGGTARGVITGTPGAVVHIYAGGVGSVTAGGFNGGGPGGISSSTSGGGGGGASDVRINGNTLADRVLVAAGGGGAGGSSSYLPPGGAGGGGSAFSSAPGFGGAGGGSSCGTAGNGGEQGGLSPTYGTGGGGGGYASGGGGGGQGSSTGGYGCPGTLGNGGAGGGTSFICGGATGGVNGGGGGGGGYYGGGGGMTGTGGCHGGGGGGSSWVHGTLMSSPGFTAGNSAGNGSVTISYVLLGSTVTATPPSTAICNGNSLGLTAGGVVSYTWLPVGAFGGSNNQNILVSPASNTTYTLQGTNSLGCISEVTVPVIVNSGLPVLSVNASTTNVCLGRTVTLTATGALSYAWTGGVTNGQSFVPSGSAMYTVTGTNGCGSSTATQSITVSQLPVTAATSAATICSGYTASLSAVSGVTGYTWAPGNYTFQNVVVAPSSTTIYTVTASDGTCSGTASVVVNTIPIPTVTAVASDTDICQGDVVTMSTSGAQSYVWSPGNQTATSFTDNPQVATMYVVIGTAANGCTSSAQQPVVVYQAPIINITSSKAVVCVAGGANLTATGSNTLTWIGGPSTAQYSVNPVSTTVYSVIGLAPNTCTAMATYTVGVFDPVLTVSGSSAVCPGGTATLSATGGNNNTYSWNGGPTGPNFASFSPATSTVYLVTAQSSSAGVTCPASGSHSVDVYPQPNISIVASKTVMCRRDAVPTLTANGGTSYMWLHNNSTTNTQTVTSNINGTFNYQVIGYDANNCEDTASIAIKTEACVGLKDIAQRISLSVYPNPSNGSFVITADEAVHLSVVNQAGQLVSRISLTAENGYSIEVKDLAAGIYFLTGEAEGSRINEKIIVTR